VKLSYFKLHFLLSFVLIFILNSSLLALETLPHVDHFESSSADGWSFDNGDTNELELDRGDSSFKVYDFGATHANKEVTVIMQVDVYGGWESNSDKIEITFNDSEYYEYFTADISDEVISYSTTLSSSGTLKVLLKANTNNNDEELQVEYVQIIQGNYSLSDREFSLREDYTLFGDVVVSGNSVLCQLNTSATACVESGANISNAGVNLQKAPQSSASITIPPSAKVKSARLYWVGRKINNSLWDATSIDSAKTIHFREGLSGAYTTITADVIDINYNQTRPIYSASADVSNFITSSGTFDVDTNAFYTITGATNTFSSNSDGLGAFGAWTLVVVYEDPNETITKNISIFDGYRQITDSDEDITVTGFLTPKEDDVDSKLYLFTSEGDRYITGDEIKMGGYKYNTTQVDIGTFNSRIDTPGIRVPDLSNNNGIDIQVYDVGTTAGALGIISNDETGANFKFTTSGDHYFASMLIFSTEIYQPRFCYDYAYKQNGVYFTQDNDGSKDPYIAHNVNKPSQVGSPIEVTLYFKNQIDSDLSASNMKISILDINTSQISYIRDTTKRQLVGEPAPAYKTDAQWGTSVSDSFINNLDIGTQVNNDYFYVYYQVDPIVDTELNAKISAELTYDLVLPDSTTIAYTLQLNSNLPMCSTTNLNYVPSRGIFNVVHTPTFNSIQKYNLPTQITNRAGDFSVISIDDDFSDNVDNLVELNTSFWVEMIDVGGFHLTEAACQEANNSISTKKAFVLIDSNMVSISSEFDASFYQTARQNTAFRITYNLYDDEQSLLSVVQGSDGTYKIKEFPNYANNDCNIPGSTQKVANACDSAAGNNNNFSNGLTMDELEGCMECIYGKKTKFVCSRDNFAIRPEAFMIKLNDQNQTNTTIKARISDNVSGVNTPSNTLSHLAAGYNYSLEVTAVNHLNNTPSNGYTRSFDSSFLDDNISFLWSEPNAVTCDDERSPEASIRVLNGYAETNTSVSQSGIYNLSIVDSTWTGVDSNPIYRTHHDDDPYLQGSSVLDCIPNSALTFTQGSTQINGCQINSNHNASASNLKYRNYALKFHPYTFDLNAITPTIGKNNNPLINGSFIYMSDLNQSEDMGLHLNGDIKAVGYDNTLLSNFTSSCYAQSLDASIVNDVALNSDPAYRYRYHNLNSTSNDINATLNSANDTITLAKSNFLDPQKGLLSTQLHLNFDRKVDTAINPIQVTYGKYNINCSTPANCQFNADFTNKETKGSVSINNTLNHLYGRTNAPRKVFSGSYGIDFIYFEAYCDGCDMNILPNTTFSQYNDDPRWFINANHTLNDGEVGRVTQKYLLSPKVTTSNPLIFANPTQVGLTYDETSGYTYKTTMENNASSWLIHNRFNNNDTNNEFEIEFSGSTNSWGGIDKANSTSDTKGANKTNRRIMW